MISHDDFIVIPDGFDIPFESEKVHGISESRHRDGVAIQQVVESFVEVEAEFLLDNLRVTSTSWVPVVAVEKENILTTNHSRYMY